MSAMLDPATEEVVTSSEGIARILTQHWQDVFKHKATDRGLRSQWISALSRRLNVSLEILTPTRQDV
eukprot:1722088-Karenia_brevis.AAC.1